MLKYYLTLEGAYCRRYKTAEAIEEDFHKDLDFRGWLRETRGYRETYGYVNKSQLQEMANKLDCQIIVRLEYKFATTTVIIEPEKGDTSDDAR